MKLQKMVLYLMAVLIFIGILYGCSSKLDYGFTKYYALSGDLYKPEDIKGSKKEQNEFIASNIRFAIDKEGNSYSFKLIKGENGKYSPSTKLIQDNAYNMRVFRLASDNSNNALTLISETYLFLVDTQTQEVNKICEISTNNWEKIGSSGFAAYTYEENNPVLYMYGKGGDTTDPDRYALFEPIKGIKSFVYTPSDNFRSIVGSIEVTAGDGNDYQKYTLNLDGVREADALFYAKNWLQNIVATLPTEEMKSQLEAQQEADLQARQADEALGLNSKYNSNCYDSRFDHVNSLKATYNSQGILESITIKFKNPLNVDIYNMDVVYEIYDNDNNYISTIHKLDYDLTSLGDSTEIVMSELSHWDAYKFKLVKLDLFPN